NQACLAGLQVDWFPANSGRIQKKEKMMAVSEKPLMGMRVAVVMTDGVEQSDFVEPRNALIKAGAQVTEIGSTKGEIQAFNHHDKAEKLKAEKSLEVSANDFDALLLPGWRTECRCLAS